MRTFVPRMAICHICTRQWVPKSSHLPRTRAAGEEPEFQPRNTTQRGEFVQALAVGSSVFPVPTTMYPISPGLEKKRHSS